MVGIIGIIAALTVLGISLVITRIATTALSLTGLSWEAARFQSRSAFTGTGFTTKEAEKIVSHPLRRKIIMMLMVARSAGFLSIIMSLILSFGSTAGDDTSRLLNFAWLLGGVGLLWILASSDYLELWMRRVIKKGLKRWTDLELHDYTDLLKLTDDYTVIELEVEKDDWLAKKTLKKCCLSEEGILVLGIYRTDGSYVGAPASDTKMYPGDIIVLYGRSKALHELDQRQAGYQGERKHEKAKDEQRQEEATQAEKDADYAKKKEQQES
ncbi:MAG TPA: TrkA C-terminal domain-containing protein [Desulfopila sp.]|nr:TrkA C-terminal domain-containing protein [Desulfopila sp.]